MTTETATKERPIIFASEMVQSILAGRKTQHRVIVKPQPVGLVECGPGGDTPGNKFQPNRHLWVRETWADTNGESGPMISYRAGGDKFLVDESFPVDYSLYPNCLFSMWCGDLRRGAEGHAWRSPTHMPRWASRITLEITDVRMQRVQEISEADAQAEGVLRDGPVGNIPAALAEPFVYQYAGLWDRINGDGSWAANSWCWCISFRKV